MAAAIVTSRGLEKIGAVGVRKAGTLVPISLDDKWHLGSDTKAMTAALVACLVENCKLQWSQVLGPAGRVNCKLQDWSLFIADQLRGLRGEPALLKSRQPRPGCLSGDR